MELSLDSNGEMTTLLLPQLTLDYTSRKKHS